MTWSREISVCSYKNKYVCLCIAIRDATLDCDPQNSSLTVFCIHNPLYE
jgi:hypothetical protein